MVKLPMIRNDESKRIHAKYIRSSRGDFHAYARDIPNMKPINVFIISIPVSMGKIHKFSK